VDNTSVCHIKNVRYKVRQTLECKFAIVMDKAHSVQASACTEIICVKVDRCA